MTGRPTRPQGSPQPRHAVVRLPPQCRLWLGPSRHGIEAPTLRHDRHLRRRRCTYPVSAAIPELVAPLRRGLRHGRRPAARAPITEQSALKTPLRALPRFLVEPDRGPPHPRHQFRPARVSKPRGGHEAFSASVRRHVQLHHVDDAGLHDDRADSSPIHRIDYFERAGRSKVPRCSRDALRTLQHSLVFSRPFVGQ